MIYSLDFLISTRLCYSGVFLIFVIPPCCFFFCCFFNVFTQKCVCSILLVFSQNLAPGMSPSDSPQKTIQGTQILVQIGARRACFISILCFCCFSSKLGPGNVIIGFLAKNYTGYTNFRPNWRHEALFYEHVVFCCFYSE